MGAEFTTARCSFANSIYRPVSSVQGFQWQEHSAGAKVRLEGFSGVEAPSSVSAAKANA